VVATAYPLYEAVASVGGKHVHAIDLLPLDPYGPISAEKTEELLSAPLAVVLGEGIQPEVDKIVMRRTLPTIRLSNVDGVDVEDKDDDHNVWLDPQNMTQIADRISDALNTLVPSKSNAFHKNLDRYEEGLASVDRSYVQALATCKRQSFLVEKAEYSSLAQRYGLQQVVVGSLDLKTPDETIRKAIAEHDADTIFAPTLPSLDDAKKIRDLYGVRVAVLDPVAAQTDQARRGGSSYRVVMGLDLDALRAALSCAEKEH
jgi:ABC-type Zn uptake system ZnuABC Zn-binding protein ZnuA